MSRSKKVIALLPTRRPGKRKFIAGVVLLLLLAASIGTWRGTRRSGTAVALERAGVAGVAMTVYKSPTCECCAKWIALARKQGFTIDVVERVDLSPVKSSFGVPNSAVSCHTATIGDYVVEGHVPVKDILRMLAERPPVVGIAVPGMPTGAPGMTGPKVRYSVVSFDRNGDLRTFAEH